MQLRGGLILWVGLLIGLILLMGAFMLMPPPDNHIQVTRKEHFGLLFIAIFGSCMISAFTTWLGDTTTPTEENQHEGQ